MKNIQLSVIVLNWNGKKVLKECLDSIKSQTFKNFETIVVDNNSSDGSQAFVKKNYPKAKLLSNKENLGYAGGNNVGVKNAKGNYILILNNDVVLDKDFLAKLWEKKDKADILGVKNYFYNKKNLIWAVGSRVNLLTMRASLIGNKKIDKGQYDNVKIDHAVGSAIFTSKKVFEKIRYFNEDYFCYYEETEWQTRAKQAGFSISWIPEAKLWHKIAYSTGGARASSASYYQIRNRANYIKKYSKYKIIAYPYWILEVFVKVLYGLVKEIRYTKMSWKGMVDFFKGKKGKFN